MGVAGRSPEPPADVHPVGTVAQGGVLAARRGQRLAVEKGGLQQGAPQHQRLKYGRGGDAGTAAPAAAQLLLWRGGGSAAAAPAPGRQARGGRGVRPSGRFQLDEPAVGVGMWLQQTEDDLQVSFILLKRKDRLSIKFVS